MKKKHLITMLSGVAAAGVWISAAAGCRSVVEQRDLMMEEATVSNPIERPVAMRGEGSFLAGSLSAVATVRRGFERVDPRGEIGAPPPGAGQKEREEQESANFTHVYFGGVSEEDQKFAMQQYAREAQAMRAAGSPMPPVTLRVLLENRGTETIEIEIMEVNSQLGNFAPRPATVTIGPGGRAILDPMISQLGVTRDEIPLTLAVRTGNRSEKQVLLVRNIITEAALREFEAQQKR